MRTGTDRYKKYIMILSVNKIVMNILSDIVADISAEKDSWN